MSAFPAVYIPSIIKLNSIPVSQLHRSVCWIRSPDASSAFQLFHLQSVWELSLGMYLLHGRQILSALSNRYVWRWCLLCAGMYHLNSTLSLCIRSQRRANQSLRLAPWLSGRVKRNWGGASLGSLTVLSFTNHHVHQVASCCHFWCYSKKIRAFICNDMLKYSDRFHTWHDYCKIFLKMFCFSSDFTVW